MKTSHLEVLLAGAPVGTLTRTVPAPWTFRYAENWQTSPASYPLSLSMPLARPEHGEPILESWLWGLLPDNDRVLDRWGRRFQVSARNPFALLAHVGEDCAGAVQIVRPERVAHLVEGGPVEAEWLDDRAVGARLRALGGDSAAWRNPSDRGQFSLAGAQPKTALLRLDGRWGVPFGRTPTTHILKPPTAALEGHAENEHFCLALARQVGLPAARSEVIGFDGEVAIVIERYDRVNANGAIRRVHQEDLCQALGLPPISKYQNEGGPSPAHVAALLKGASSHPADDVATFVDALVFHWLVAGTDAHGKNYSILHGPGGRVRLAPLYDIASALPYPHLASGHLKLAMKIGGEYRLRYIGRPRWLRAAAEVGMAGDDLVARARGLATAVSVGAAVVAAQCRAQGLEHPIVDRLAEAITSRAHACGTRLG